MRVAIMGHRGVPAAYGGFETLAQEISWRLVEKGHDVTVYVRSRYATPGLKEWRGVELVVLPSVSHKYLDTPSHTFVSSLHALTRGFDAVLLLNAANVVFVPILRLPGVKVALNVDGIERRRRKWGPLGRFVYLVSERLAIWLPNELVTDARTIYRYYLDRFQAPSTLITYGAPKERAPGRETLEKLGLAPESYVLYVSRLEPENNALAVVKGFEGVKDERKLLVVGDAPYSRDYIAKVKATKDPRVVFPGAIFGSGYAELQSNAFAYVHATEVGGTHPALVEAMGYGNAIVCHRTDENEETLGDAGLYWDARDPSTLTEALQRLAGDEALRQSLRERAAARAQRSFDWDDITAQYEEMLERMIIPGTLGFRR